MSRPRLLIVAIDSIICVVRAEAKETVQQHNTEDGLFSVRYALELKKEFRFQHLIKQSTTSL
jgi:hypothetical protein